MIILAAAFAIVIDYVTPAGAVLGTTVGFGFIDQVTCEARLQEIIKLHSDDELKLRGVCIDEDDLHEYMNVPHEDS